jgi:hypothetical protein
VKKEIDSGLISDEYWDTLNEHSRRRERIQKVVDICDNSNQVIKVCETLKFSADDTSWALGIYATTPRQKKIGVSA